MTTGRHESCATVALHRYGADIRPQAGTKATPLWRYTAMVPTYDHRHAWKLRHCGVTPLWCRHTTTGMHGSCTAEALHRMVQTYDHRHARRLRHCGVMPLWCRHRAVLHVHQYEGKARHALIKALN